MTRHASCANGTCAAPLTRTTGFYEVRYREYERVEVVLKLCRRCGAGLESVPKHRQAASPTRAA